MKIPLMKFLDEYAGRLIAFALAIFFGKRGNAGKKSPRKILVTKFWGIGSVTLSIPLLVHLKKKYPECEIHYLTLESNLQLCRIIQEADVIHAVSTESLFSFFKTFTKAMSALRREPIEVVFDLEFFTNVSAIVSALVGAPQRIGFVNRRHTFDVRKRLYTQQVEFCADKHTAENFLRLAGADDAIQFSPFRLGEGRGEDSTFPKNKSSVLTPTSQSSPCWERKEISPTVRGGLEWGKFSVLFNINASPLAYERRWEREEFRRLAEFLIEEFDVYLYLTGTDDERTYVQEFFQSLDCQENVMNCCGELSIQGLVRLMRRCHLVVTNDSGPLHLASALNIPTIAFFGPETPQRYGSLSDLHLTFYKNLWCSPCMTISNLKTVNCINDRQCMKQIRFAEIKEEIDSFVRSLPKIQNEIVEHSAAGEA